MATVTQIPGAAAQQAVLGRGPFAAGRYVRLGLMIGLGLSIAWQAALAGRFLSGQASALRLHEYGAYAVVLLAVTTLIVEVVSGWSARRWGRSWLAGLLAGAIVVQLLLGFTSVRQAQALAYHVPLGVFIAGLYVYYLSVGLRRAPR